MVEVILRKDVADLGRAGELVQVRPGYARNYLVPQGMGLVATAGNLRRFEEERRKVELSAVRERDDAAKIAGELQGQSVTFKVRAGDGGKLFGSVTAADIAAALEEDGHVVDKRLIRLDDPIKELGVYDVPIRLHADVEPALQVRVVADE